MVPSTAKGCDYQRSTAERGAALIVVLVMLLLLSILGMTLLTSSTTELQIAGNYRTTQEAFYAADAALEVAQTDPDVYTTIIPGVQNRYSSNVFPIGNNTATYRVEYIDRGPPPAGSGNDDSFQSNFYVINVNSSGPNQATVELESQIARIVPKAKDY